MDRWRPVYAAGLEKIAFRPSAVPLRDPRHYPHELSSMFADLETFIMREAAAVSAPPCTPSRPQSVNWVALAFLCSGDHPFGQEQASCVRVTLVSKRAVRRDDFGPRLIKGGGQEACRVALETVSLEASGMGVRPQLRRTELI